MSKTGGSPGAKDGQGRDGGRPARQDQQPESIPRWIGDRERQERRGGEAGPDQRGGAEQ